ncbi:MAG: hypothetical protein KGY78_08460, partial [Anaerolineae bacterium]|nr:hypothetical protein [Anaerolineae bacterium]
MKTATDVLCVLYGWLNRLYPPGFRATFGEEMQAVFAAAAAEAGSRGLAPLLVLWFRELGDWPGAVLSAYWWRARQVHARIKRQGGMMMENAWSRDRTDRLWAIDDRSRAMVAALPPVVMGVGIAAAAMINGRSWFDLTIWQQGLVILLTALPVGILSLGGLIALIRSIPEWSYAWAGGTFVAATVLFP